MGIGEVGLETCGASPGGLDLPRQLARAGLGLALMQGTGHTPLCQCLRHGAAQPAPGAGHQCHLAP